MVRKMLLGLGFVAMGLTVGCESGSKSTSPTAGKPATTVDKAKEAVKEGADKAKDVAGKTVDKAKDVAGKAGEAVKEGAEKAKEVAKEGADKAKEVAGKAGEAVKDAAVAGKDLIIKGYTETLPKIEEKLKGLSGDAATKAKAKFDEVKKLVEEFKAAPAEKTKELGEKLVAALGELKKLVGL